MPFSFAKIVIFLDISNEKWDKFEKYVTFSFYRRGLRRDPASGYLVTARAERSGRGCDLMGAARIFCLLQSQRQRSLASRRDFPQR